MRLRLGKYKVKVRQVRGFRSGRYEVPRQVYKYPYTPYLL
jgi:hypothetical protein